MAAVVPIGEFVTESYPGHPGSYDESPPWLVDPYTPFRAEDQSRFWFLDFHWPRGLTPMGLLSMADGYARATQYAAQHLPLPSGRGIAVRSAGTHIYGAEILVDARTDRAERMQRFGRVLPVFIRDFNQIWQDRRTEIDADWHRLRRADPAGMSRAQLRDHLQQARAHYRRAWEVHFELMYPLLANYLAFRGLCTELGIESSEVSKFIESGETQITATDRELWRLAKSARSAGLGPIFAAGQPDGLAATLAEAGGKAAGWLAKFGSFLDTYGWRTEGTDDISLPSWIEDPTSPLGTIKAFLQKEIPHDFTAARAAAVEARETALDVARSKLTRGEQAAFDAGLADCHAANFTWWHEEHDYYIDLRATLPLRRACLAIAESVGADEHDDTLFLFWSEMMAVLDGEADFHDLKGLVHDRRQYYDYWRERRVTMPRALGAGPDTVSDPIMMEVFGLNNRLLHTVSTTGSGEHVESLHGVPAARGRARGRALVLSYAEDLHRIRSGDVLVCESTGPNWTPAFAQIAACVCDAGGSLSHAAIVGREYGVPTVTAVGVGTLLIRDGDEVEVDGSTGTVTIFRRHDKPEASR